MSKLGAKLHSVIYRLRGGVDVAAHDVEDVVKEVSAHINEAIVPAIEAKIESVLPDILKKAVNEALQYEREEAQKVAAKLEETYTKLVEQHGVQAANQAMAEAATPEPEPAEHTAS
jgi:hypothetical protein